MAGVGDANGDEFTAQSLFRRLTLERHRLGADRQRAAGRHGVLGVDRKIEDGELELAGVDADRAHAVRHVDLDVDIGAQRARQQLAQQRQPLRQIDDLRRQGLLARIGQQLAGERFAALGGGRHHVEQPHVFLVGQFAAQPLHAAADDHQQIVEIVRDAAGQLADRLQPLRLAQRTFRQLAAVGLVVKPLGAPQRQRKTEKQERRRRQAEDQMAAHVVQPIADDRRFFHAGKHIDRKSGELTVADAAVDAVKLRVDREDIAFQAALDADAKLAAVIELGEAVLGHRIARQKAAVGARHAEIAACQRCSFSRRRSSK